ncbi:MAG: histidine kinase [Betaproteobacteria bacterium]|nr:histidine kinase [Betaproteobacteria bacterium]MCL2885535.1 histidine kinase [Betaproteobacteria bacterium]
MSIRQFPATHPLPDWRNFGIMLRVLLGVNLLALTAALLRAPDLAMWPHYFLELAAIVEPLLLAVLGLLALARDGLWRLPLRLAQAAVLLLAGVLAFALYGYWGWLLPNDAGSLWRAVVLAMTVAALLLFYFELRSSAFSPSQAEARLAALNARIRPHFLFNSLNTVLSLIRARPQQAEEALESLSDLFRAAMRDPGALVSLDEEIELAERYLELEHLRLGERLAVDWQIAADVRRDLRIPPLMLQPLLENAVYHGIEPMAGGGTVRVAISRRNEELCIVIGNPADASPAHVDGNRMALGNIRERLALYYDLEARLDIEHGPATHEVRIILPWRQKNP